MYKPLILMSCLLLTSAPSATVEAQPLLLKKLLTVEDLPQLLDAEDRLRGGDAAGVLSGYPEVEAAFVRWAEECAPSELHAVFARLLVLKAVAELGAGLPREALWDWTVARQLFPGLVEESRLESFGEVGFGMRELTWEDLTVCSDCDDPNRSANSADITPPKKIQSPFPTPPQIRRLRGQDDFVLVVQVVVDEQGMPLDPRISEAHGDPLFIASGLAALREWRFEPARLSDGMPLVVYYQLALNYTRDEARHQPIPFRADWTW